MVLDCSCSRIDKVKVCLIVIVEKSVFRLVSPTMSFLVALGSNCIAYKSDTVTLQPCLLSSSTATFFKDPFKDLGS